MHREPVYPNLKGFKDSHPSPAGEDIVAESATFGTVRAALQLLVQLRLLLRTALAAMPGRSEDLKLFEMEADTVPRETPAIFVMSFYHCHWVSSLGNGSRAERLKAREQILRAESFQNARARPMPVEDGLRGAANARET